MNFIEIVCALVFTGLCIGLAYIYSILNRSYFYWDKKKVNGPIPRYIIGTWNGFAQKFLGSEDYTNSLKYPNVYGTYDGVTPNLLVTDPDLIKEILVASSEKFQDARFASESSVVLKDSLLYLSGGTDPETQSFMNSLISSQNFEKVIPALETCADSLIKKISAERQEDGRLNMTSAVEEFVNEAMGLAVLGIDLNADLQFKDEFVKNSKQILKVKAPQSIWSLLPFLYESYFKEPWIFPTNALQYFVNLVLEGISDSAEISVSEEKTLSLINLLVEAAEEEKKLVKKEAENESASTMVLTDNAIISRCVASLLTLANATRTTVLFSVYALANNNDIQERLYQEIQRTKSEKLTYEDIQNLVYLDKIVKEVLRLYPFEFRLERISVEGGKLKDIDLDKNIRVSIPLYALHRLEKEFPEPEKFDPERFSEAVSDKRNPFAYLPFGQAGFNGSDLSLQFGIFTTKVTLYKLVDNFKFSVSETCTLGGLFKKGFTRVPQPENIEIIAETRI